MKIYAIDQSSNKVGWAFFENGELFESDHIEIKHDGSDYSRYRAMKHFISEELTTWLPDLVVTEDPMSLARVNPKVCRILMITFSAILATCGVRGVQFLYLSPSEIKKLTTGKGNAKKDQVREAINLKYGKNIQSEDECDAIAIGLTALSKIIP